MVRPGVTLTIDGNVNSFHAWDIQGSVIANSSARIFQRDFKNLTVEGAMVFEAGSYFKSVAAAFKSLVIDIKNQGQLLANGTEDSPVILMSPFDPAQLN